MTYQIVTNELMDNHTSTFLSQMTGIHTSLPLSINNKIESGTDMAFVNEYSLQPTTSQDSTSTSCSLTNPKNKSGNGLKSKNSNKRQGVSQNGCLPDDVFIHKRLKLDTQNTDLNEGVELLAKRLEEDTKSFVEKSLPIGANISALSSSNSSASSSSSASPTPLLVQPWQLTTGVESSVPENQKILPPPIVDLATPEVITVDGTPSPISLSKDEPVVVDLCQADKTDIQMLYKDFCEMFPHTPKLYLEQQAADLVGKHAAINRFIDELFANDSRPPDYWEPDVLPVLARQASLQNGKNEISQSSELNSQLLKASVKKEFREQNDLTILATKNIVPEIKTATLENSRVNCLEGQKNFSSDKLNFDGPPNENLLPFNGLNQYENPVPGPSGTQTSNQCPNPSFAPTIPLHSPESSESPFLEGQESVLHEQDIQPGSAIIEGQTPNSIDITDTEEERREQQMDKRVQNLLSLFPHKDPEYLRAKNNEFGLDAAGVTSFETWVLEVVENGGKDLPSKEDYERRKKVSNLY